MAGRIADMRSWAEMIDDERQRQYDGPVVACTLTDKELHTKFDASSEGAGPEFTAWTARRVYFPATTGRGVWAESVSRRPDGVPTKHVGG